MGHRTGQTEVWEEMISIPTYGVGEPDKNPMFMEKRVYQGSSGKVYPLPVIDKIYDEKRDQTYKAVFLENDYLKVMILPELGGRIQRAYDKTNGYDFVYYNEVIKPALVGLAGPWISGGIEFNWPQHHRPTTFSPVDYQWSQNEDGSCTVKCSEVDQMYGTKGTMMFTLYPDKAYIEIKGQLYNRTNLPQTFLWWANPAVPVNDYTQSIFPPDVHAVFDHGKRDVSKFPIATGVYYKHDYGEGVDISRYKNIPVPTSYMCYHSDYNFVGGYDYQKEAGILHIADHHISPGKKQWTWGCGDFGQAWDRNLTDENGPYIELMTGVFTDNQPDFTWLKPFEEKEFTQYFMPYKKAAQVKNASTEAVLGLEAEDGRIKLVVYATGVYPDAKVRLTAGDKVLYEKTATISPVEVLEDTVDWDGDKTALRLSVMDQTGREMLSYVPEAEKIEEIPEPAAPAKLPGDIMTCEELYLTGQHIEQYRHATYDPDPYYLEGLKRDPGDIRLNNSYGMLLLRRGCFAESEVYFRKAQERSTWRNPNPYDGEASFNLGLSLWYQGREKEAYDAFYKATWSAAQQEMGFYYLAAIDCRAGEYEKALEHIERSISRNTENVKARGLKGLILETLGRKEEAAAWYEENLKKDGFDYISMIQYSALKQEKADPCLKLMADRVSTFMECAIDYGEAGFVKEAAGILTLCQKESPMLHYYEAYYASFFDKERMRKALEAGAQTDPAYCFPNKLEDILVLEFVMEENSKDGYAPYYLGNLFYDKKQYERAAKLWERAAAAKPQFPTVFRNLALAYYNKQKKPKEALACMEKAFVLNQKDARIFLELDQLHKKMGMKIEERLELFHKHMDVVEIRDDLYVEYVTMLNSLGRYQESYDLIMKRRFHPWEGGEGKITTQYAVALTQLGKCALENGEAARAVELLEQALVFPHNLGEGKLEGAKDNNIYYYLGLAKRELGQKEEAEECLLRASVGTEEPAGMMYYNDQPADLILYQGLANQALGKTKEALSRFHKLIDYGEKHVYDDVRIDYFAVSLPDLQLFEEDLNKRNQAHCYYLMGLGNYGLGNYQKAGECYGRTLELDCSHLGAILHRKLLK